MRALSAIISILLITVATRSHAHPFQFQTITLTNKQPTVTVQIAWRPNTIEKHPVILMLSSVTSNSLPFWSTNLLNEGYMLAAFSDDRPPVPEPARRPQWLYFDQRFAHSDVRQLIAKRSKRSISQNDIMVSRAF